VQNYLLLISAATSLLITKILLMNSEEYKTKTLPTKSTGFYFETAFFSIDTKVL